MFSRRTFAKIDAQFNEKHKLTYPTVVIVIRAHQNDSGILVNFVPGSPSSTK